MVIREIYQIRNCRRLETLCATTKLGLGDMSKRRGRKERTLRKRQQMVCRLSNRGRPQAVIDHVDKSCKSHEVSEM
jgi:hypothetical protein